MLILKDDRPGRGARSGFVSLTGSTKDDLRALAARIGPKFTAQDWYEAFDAILADRHARAWRYGRVLGLGESGKLTSDDLALGRLTADLQSRWLLNFLDDIEGGRYTEEDGSLNLAKIGTRSDLYAKRLRGTANESWAECQSGDISWRLGGAELHCDDCPELAALSPFTKETLFTYPGAGQTMCLSNCTCNLTNEDGQRAF